MSTDAAEDVPPAGAGRTASFREVFAVREFRPLFGTFLLSTAGDELARVALTVLVYQRTDSPLLTALTFAIGHLPWLLGGPLLSAFADRLPRHRVLIACDIVRALLLALMALPGMPLPALLGLLFLVSLCAPPFESARSALMADVLEGERYAVATSLTNVTLQLAQVVGFLAAGALVAVLDPSAALLIDAVTFVVSAVWLSSGLQRRPAPVVAAGERPRSLWQDTAEGLRLIGRSPRLLAIVAILWVGTLFGYAWEGVATPLVDELGMPLVVLSLVPLLVGGAVVAVAGPGTVPFAVLIGLLFVSGLGASWVIPLNVSFVQAVPSAFRGRAFGVAVSGLYGVQGIGALAAGLAAEGVAPSGVMALCGGLGLLAVIPPLLAYRRTQGHMAAATAAEGA
jgi:hypothetical protein